MTRFTIALLAAGFLFSTSIFCEEKPLPEKKKITIMNFEGINVDEALAIRYRNSIEVALFQSNEFVMVERENIDSVLQEMKISGKDLSKETSLSEAGRIIATDYIITGKIEKTDKYIVTIKVISVEDGKIVNVYDKKVNNVKKLTKEVKNISNDITEDLTNKKPRRFLITYRLNYIFFQGKLKDTLNNGAGLSIELTKISPFYNNLYFQGSLGFNYCNGRVNENDLAIFIPAGANMRYNFNIINNFYLSPVVFLGIETIILSHEKDPGFENMVEDSTKVGFDPIVSFGVRGGYFYSDTVYFEIGCEYSALYEPKGMLYALGCNLAIAHYF